MENTNQFLGTERVGKLMRRYAVPCIISLLVGALYNIVDQIFIANASYLGSYGNAANTVVFPLTVVALAIAGVTDTAALNWGLEGPDPEKALSGLSKDITKLMLSHRPSLAPESAKAGASLQLSGHTHGGLILPVTPLIAAFNGGYVSGPYTVDGMPLYVSSGSGLWGGIPLRLFVPSEITLITLTGTGFDTN